MRPARDAAEAAPPHDRTNPPPARRCRRLAAPPGASTRTTPATSRTTSPAGRISRDARQARRFGYFRNFDPKACQLEVTPPERHRPARLADRPRRHRVRQGRPAAARPPRRVDARRARATSSRWTSPGSTPAAGTRSITSTPSATRTTSRHTITRGNDDPKDDVEHLPRADVLRRQLRRARRDDRHRLRPRRVQLGEGPRRREDLLGRRPVQLPRRRRSSGYGGEHTLTTIRRASSSQDGPRAAGVPRPVQVLDGRRRGRGAGVARPAAAPAAASPGPPRRRPRRPSTPTARPRCGSCSRARRPARRAWPSRS